MEKIFLTIERPVDKFKFLSSSQAVILTANRRQALFLSQYFLKSEEKISGWLPSIIPLTEWCRMQYEKIFLQAAQSLPVLLSDLQTQVIWQQLIPQTALSQHAYSAYEWLHQWQLPLTVLATDESEDVQWFYQHAEKFPKKYFTLSQVINFLIKQKYDLPKEIMLFGFNEFSPQIKQLIRSWQHQEVKVQVKRQIEIQQTNCQRTNFLEEEQEWYAMAQWANEQIVLGKKVACVIPDVQANRLQIMRVFQQFPAAFDIALGSPLSESYLFNQELNSLLLESSYKTLSEWSHYFTHDQLKENVQSLDHLVGKLSALQAKSFITFLASKIIIQQAVEPPAIAILGLLEAASLNFDALWVMGLNADTWPKPPKPNPFLPIQLQRAQGMPHSSYDRERLFALQLTRSLIRSAPEVILSCVKTPSRFILRYPEIQLTGHSPLLRQVATYPLEKIIDDQAPGIKKPFFGNSELLSDQAKCPFRAFAHYRLNARFEMEDERRSYARERGLVIHEVLQHYYSGQNKDLNHSIEWVLKKTTWPKVYKQLEKIRLEKLLNEFLKQEHQRESFTVKACELKHTFQLHHNLHIHARIDRIDELADGRYAIIDYKTGVISMNGWMDERLTSPQLPLYHLYDKNRVAEISLVQLQTQSVKFKSLATENYSDVWLAQLQNLAEEFLSGVAHIAPDEHCGYCDLKVLCRVNDFIFP